MDMCLSQRKAAEVWRILRLAAVLAAVACLWACYRTTRVPGAEAPRLRELTSAPRVGLRVEDRVVEVDRATEVVIKTVRGAEFSVTPSMLSYSPTAMKLGPSASPDATVVRYDDVASVGVREFSVGRTLALALPAAGVALYLVAFALLCGAGAGFGC